MPFINLRSHKKVLVVDGRLAFTGSMNVADENVMATQPRHPVQDRTRTLKIEFAVLQAAACARDSIEVMTPYFLPDERLTTALALAAMRGVAVDVVIPERSDHRFVDWATHANVGPLLAEGVRVWRCPPPFRHSKILVVDGEWCPVGSCNWDIRSFRLNFELCLEVHDRGLAGQLAALMLACRGSALTQAALDRRPAPVRLRDSAVRLMLPYL